MPMHKVALLVAMSLAVVGCGADAPEENLALVQPVETRTCESIRDDVIRTAAQNGVNIVKIYEPKTILDTPDKLDCSGRALVGTGQQATIYFRSFKDADGDRLIQYSETKLD